MKDTNFSTTSTSLMLTFLCAVRSLNSLTKTFLVKHRISFDVKTTESSKVSLSLNSMIRQKPEQETHF